jgi:hypothetical protein
LRNVYEKVANGILWIRLWMFRLPGLVSSSVHQGMTGGFSNVLAWK